MLGRGVGGGKERATEEEECELARMLQQLAVAEHTCSVQDKELSRRKDELQIELGQVSESLEDLHHCKVGLQQSRAILNENVRDFIGEDADAFLERLRKSQASIASNWRPPADNGAADAGFAERETVALLERNVDTCVVCTSEEAVPHVGVGVDGTANLQDNVLSEVVPMKKATKAANMQARKTARKVARAAAKKAAAEAAAEAATINLGTEPDPRDAEVLSRQVHAACSILSCLT